MDVNEGPIPTRVPFMLYSEFLSHVLFRNLAHFYSSKILRNYKIFSDIYQYDTESPHVSHRDNVLLSKINNFAL
jgi:hypothetical protein